MSRSEFDGNYQGVVPQKRIGVRALLPKIEALKKAISGESNPALIAAMKTELSHLVRRLMSVKGFRVSRCFYS